ncbi:MAG: NAD(+)/NADH kinase [Candidatus Bathyarchaeia archaeon]|nr:NAD(+)/NADH kinase [Candidatus Bathyarchaeota archaeon]
MRIGVVSRIDNPEALSIAKEIMGYIDGKGMEAVIEKDTAIALDLSIKGIDLGEMNVDLLVVVGGDGTILRTVMLMGNQETPILGVKLGRRGFLSEVSASEAKTAVERVLREDYSIEECLKISSRCLETGEVFPDALNEVLVSKPLPSKAIELGLTIDGVRLTDLRGDGAMVATPTGSTAYSFSAGGSVIAPGVEAMILTPVCSDSLFRSIVTPSTSRIEIQHIKPDVNALLIVDGRVQTALRTGSTVEIRASTRRTKFIRFRSFYERLGVILPTSPRGKLR